MLITCAFPTIKTIPGLFFFQNPLTKRSLKLSALDATNFSRTVSYGKSPHEEDFCETMFPYIDECLCYSCSRNYSEMKYSDVTYIPNLPQNK